METNFKTLDSFFEKSLAELKCNYDTRSYIIGIFNKYSTANYDLSKDSLTLTFSQAKNNRDFLLFQTLADYLFFTNVMHPASLNNASKDYYYSLARLSYYSCYKIVHSWLCYQQLADEFIVLSEKSRKLILKQNVNNFEL